MGEYAKINGEQIKLGTLDDWRYVRRDEVERWQPLASEGGTGMGLALAAEEIVWRFPFPWEDNENPEDVHGRTMGKPALTVAIPGEIEHQRVTVSMGLNGAGQGGAFNVNVRVPCPYTLGNRPGQEPASDLEVEYCSAVPDNTYATIWGERVGGERGHRTDFKCIYCGAPVCLSV